MMPRSKWTFDTEQEELLENHKPCWAREVGPGNPGNHENPNCLIKKSESTKSFNEADPLETKNICTKFNVFSPDPVHVD